MLNKFSNITYPVYCLTKVPEVVVDYEKLTTTSGKLIKHNKYTANTYLNSLILMDKNKEDRLHFNVTARDIGELIRSKVQWGVDNTGLIFDFSIKQKFPFMITKINKITQNLMWIKNVSYPLELPEDLETIKYDLYLYFIYLAQINYTWEIYDFSLSLPKKDRKWIYL